MWVTLVREMFSDGDQAAVRDGLEEIASPLDSYGWSSNGIYCFWDPTTRQVLYIGLAIDLPDRFAQHTGLKSYPERGCKRAAIKHWFGSHEWLGYSVLLQSANMQPDGYRLAMSQRRRLAKGDATAENDPLPHELADLEGRLLQSHALQFGALPPWNQMGGSAHGSRQVRQASGDELFALLTGTLDDSIVARRTIRELAEDHHAVGHEEYLHTQRLRASMILGLGGDPASAKARSFALGWPDEPMMTARREAVDAYLLSPSPFLVTRNARPDPSGPPSS